MNSCKKRILVLLCLALAIGTTTCPASAYETTGWHITSTKTFVPYSGFTSLSRTHMRSAANQWSARVSSFTPLVVSTGTHSDATGYPSRDRKNYIYRIDIGDGYLAQTSTWAGGGIVSECDINVNTFHPWANSAKPGCYDVYSVILHEFGHTMGLDDLTDSTLYSYNTTVMWHEGQPGTTNRNLKNDDKNGIDAIYN